MPLDDYTTEQVLAALEAVLADHDWHTSQAENFDDSTTPTVVAVKQFIKDNSRGFAELSIRSFKKELSGHDPVPLPIAVAMISQGLAGWMAQLVFDGVRRLEAADELRRLASIPGGSEEEEGLSHGTR